MNILVFGRDGQLGRAFKSFFDAKKMGELHCIHYFGRLDCNLENPREIQEALKSYKPHLIINAAAYTAVDLAETEEHAAYAINAKAPAIMACSAAKLGATFLHYSTDYVFDGTKNSPYEETDIRNPLSVYGKSKAAGEVAIEDVFRTGQKSHIKFEDAEFGFQFAIFRTSWVYGNGSNFIRTILRLAKERKILKVVADQYGVPTSATWLASISMALVLDDNQQLKSFPSGVYHSVPKGVTTWHSLACYVVQLAIDMGVELMLTPNEIKAIPSSDYSQLATRPKNSRLATLALENTLTNMTQLELLNQSWEQEVAIYVQQIALSRLI